MVELKSIACWFWRGLLFIWPSQRLQYVCLVEFKFILEWKERNSANPVSQMWQVWHSARSMTSFLFICFGIETTKWLDRNPGLFFFFDQREKSFFLSHEGSVWQHTKIIMIWSWTSKLEWEVWEESELWGQIISLPSSDWLNKFIRRKSQGFQKKKKKDKVDRKRSRNQGLTMMALTIIIWSKWWQLCNWHNCVFNYSFTR